MNFAQRRNFEKPRLPFRNSGGLDSLSFSRGLVRFGMLEQKGWHNDKMQIENK